MAKRATVLSLMLALGLSLGCAHVEKFTEEWSGAQKGAAIGGVAGAVGGGAFGQIVHGVSLEEGALVGGLGGGLIGALIGDATGTADKMQDAAAKLKAMEKERDAKAEELRACQAKGQAAGQDITNLKNKIAELERQVNALRDELNKCKGSRIEMAIPNDVLFDSGKATLTDAGRKALDEKAKLIKEAHLDKKIQIEGHTDSDPIKVSNWKSNWELGAARALAVLHYFESKHGIKAETLSASTYSMYRPVGPNDSKEGKSRNRRSVIVLYSDWPKQAENVPVR